MRGFLRKYGLDAQSLAERNQLSIRLLRDIRIIHAQNQKLLWSLKGWTTFMIPYYTLFARSFSWDEWLLAKIDKYEQITIKCNQTTASCRSRTIVGGFLVVENFKKITQISNYQKKIKFQNFQKQPKFQNFQKIVQISKFSKNNSNFKFLKKLPRIAHALHGECSGSFSLFGSATIETMVTLGRNLLDSQGSCHTGAKIQNSPMESSTPSQRL